MAEETKTEKKENVRSEVPIDLDGTANDESMRDKVLIQEDSYFGEILIADMAEVKKYTQPKDAKEVAMEKKIIFTIKLDGEGSENAELPLYCNPIIKKSGGQKGYSNSKLYDILDMAGELDSVKKNKEKVSTYEGLISFLKEALEGRKIKALVKTSNKGTDRAYSTVNQIVRFEGVSPETKDVKVEEGQ